MLKAPWNAGRATARKCAPRLLRVMPAQGWPSLRELSDGDRLMLEQDITKNPGGITSYPKVLPGRIDDLSLYEVVRKSRARGPEKPAEGMCVRHPAFREDDCAPCRQADRDRVRRQRSQPQDISGSGADLLARLRAGLEASTNTD
jgi:hypothetical protein